MKETFGQRLQRLRQAAGVSQPKLAEAAGIPVGTLRNLEQDRRIPRLDTAAALARALDVTLDELSEGIEAAEHTSGGRTEGEAGFGSRGRRPRRRAGGVNPPPPTSH